MTPTATNTPNPFVIDDFEDGDNQLMINTLGCTIQPGFWFTSDDGTAPATYVIANTGASGSTRSIQVTGGPNTSWGASAGVNFCDATPKEAVNLSAYTGISFWAKRNSGTVEQITVAFPNVNTDPDGGICTTCNDDHGLKICLSNTWTQYTIYFSQLTQEGFGSPQTSFPPTQVYGIAFKVPANVSFDFSIDEISFVTSPAPPPMSSSFIDNMEDGNMKINPALTGQPTGGSFGWNSWIGDPLYVTGPSPIQCGGYLSNFAAWANGTLTDPGTGIYPSYTLSIDLWNGNNASPAYFNASSFSGIRFWMNLQTANATVGSWTFVTLASTVDASCCGGTCASGCWDHYGFNTSANRGAGWVQVSRTFATMAQQGWGTAVPWDPTQVMQIQFWQGAGNTAGTYNILAAFDNVEFF